MSNTSPILSTAAATPAEDVASKPPEGAVSKPATVVVSTPAEDVITPVAVVVTPGVVTPAAADLGTPAGYMASDASELPPPYEAAQLPDAAVEAGVVTHVGGEQPAPAEPPPAYADDTAKTQLPSYADVQRQKRDEHDVPTTGGVSGDPLTESQSLHLWRLSGLGVDPEAAADMHEQQMLGTDLMFATAFLMAFLFNWIGFLLLLCLCHSVAGRYGALAGFGLSLAKWTLIVKNSTTMVSHDNSWLWWLIMAFGLVISVRAVLQYVYIKREWHQLPDATRRRLIFFY